MAANVPFLGFDHIDTRVSKLAAVEAFYDVEYYEHATAGGVPRFIGFIEDAGMMPAKTCIAFRASEPAALKSLAEYLAGIGAKNVELSADMENYPAVFFEDAAGTRLEIRARKAT